MIKTLSTIGNSLGLIIDKPILDLLKISKDTPLEITTDGNAITITPQRETRRVKLDRIMNEVMDDYDEAFKRLAQ